MPLRLFLGISNKTLRIMRKVSSCTIICLPSLYKLRTQWVKISTKNDFKGGKNPDRQKVKTRTSSSQPSQLYLRERKNHFVDKFVPAVISITGCPSARPSSFTGLWIKNTLLDTGEVTTAAWLAFVRDDRCTFIVSISTRGDGKAPNGGLSPVYLAKPYALGLLTPRSVNGSCGR